jgi:hypothetical protein
LDCFASLAMTGEGLAHVVTPVEAGVSGRDRTGSS